MITGCETIGVLKQAIAEAWAFKPLTDREREALLARTAAAAANGRFEPFKTSEQFDGTSQHPRWLETAQL